MRFFYYHGNKFDICIIFGMLIKINVMLQLNTSRLGALPDRYLRQCINEGIIFNGRDDQINPSSIDLTVDLNTLQEVPYVFTPSKKRSMIHETLETLGAKKVPKTNDGYLLEPNVVYVAEICEEFKSRAGLFARANPKSSTGRSDIHVRLMGDLIPQYDRIPENWSGKLYALFKTNSFRILIDQDTVCLNQLRIFRNGLGILTTEELQTLAEERLILRNDHKHKDLMFTDMIRENSIALSVDLRDWGNDGYLGYIAKKDVGRPLIWKKGANDPDDFFEPIPKIMDNRTYTVEEMRFLILSSRESVYVPREYACEMISFDDTRGEIRAHYAGFIDNDWGSEGGPRPLTLEVRAYEPTMIYHGQPIASIVLHKMYAPVEKGYDDMLTSNYTKQNRALLGKFFKQ